MKIRSVYTYGDGTESATPGYTGFTGMAKHLSKLGLSQKPVSRQLVWAWHERRASTKFPELQLVKSSSMGIYLFKIEEVEEWYRNWTDEWQRSERIRQQRQDQARRRKELKDTAPQPL